jgi:hypothetical protein
MTSNLETAKFAKEREKGNANYFLSRFFAFFAVPSVLDLPDSEHP